MNTQFIQRIGFTLKKTLLWPFVTVGFILGSIIGGSFAGLLYVLYELGRKRK